MPFPHVSRIMPKWNNRNVEGFREASMEPPASHGSSPTPALHAKLDELLRAVGEASTELATIDFHCHVERWLRDVDANAAPDLGALEGRCRCRSRATGDVQKDELIGRFGPHSLTQEAIYLLVR